MADLCWYDAGTFGQHWVEQNALHIYKHLHTKCVYV